LILLASSSSGCFLVYYKDEPLGKTHLELHPEDLISIYTSIAETICLR